MEVRSGSHSRQLAREFFSAPCLRLYCTVSDFIALSQTLLPVNKDLRAEVAYSTVTLLARLRGLSTSVPFAHAV